MRRARLTQGLIGLALVLASGFAAAAMYKWVDEQGQVHYSQSPPLDQQSEKVKAPPPPPASAADEQSKLQQQIDDLEKRQEERAKAAESEQKSAEEAAAFKAACERAKSNLQALTSRGQVSLKDGDEYRVMTEEERQARIARAKRQIEEYCE